MIYVEYEVICYLIQNPYLVLLDISSSIVAFPISESPRETLDHIAQVIVFIALNWKA